MIDDLEKLLAKADVPAQPPRNDLASVVRLVVLRRGHRKRVMSLLAVALVIGGVAVAMLTPRPRPLAPIAVPSIDVEADRREIAELQADAKFHLQIARAIERENQTHVSPAASQITFSEPDVLMQVGVRRQVAAQLMLAHAEHLAADPAKRDEATANYKKLVALFPETLASRAANDRLRAAGV